MAVAVTAAGAAPGALAAGLTLVALVVLRRAVRARRRAVASRRLPPARLLGGAGGVGPAGPSAPGRPGPGRAEAALARRLEETALPLDPAVALRAWWGGAALAVATALALAGPGAAALGAALVAAGPCVGWRLLRHRGAARVEAALPGAVEALAAALRSGASFRQALAAGAEVADGPLGADLAAAAAATERGAGLVAPLERWAERRPLPGVRLVVAALCLGAETGGATAQAVDGVALTLRQRLAAQAEAAALATQARASAVVIGASPLVFCTLAAATDARASAFLLRTPLGLALLASGLALDAVGALWMARLTRVEP